MEAIITQIFKLLYRLVIIIAALLAGCKNTETVSPAVVSPIVDFYWTGAQVAPAEIIFMNTTENATSFRWDFGNGQTSIAPLSGKIVYEQPGTYDIVLTAKNGSKSTLLKKTIVIGADAEPLAHFSYNFRDNRTAVPAAVSLINESANADAYEWNINGAIIRVKDPVDVMFNQPGDFKIQLTAIKGAKRSAIYEETVTIAANTEPRAKFVLPYHPMPYLVGEEIQFVNLSVNSDAWLWTFDPNGPASTEQHPVMKFSVPGVYTITLIAKKGNISSPPRSINLKIN